MAVFTTLASAITSAFLTIATAKGAILTAGLALAGKIVGYVGATVIYGGVALGLSCVAGKMGKSGRAGSYGDSSATYGNPVLQTQTNQDLPIPLLYGTVKLGGNRIWQDGDVSKNIKRIVGFAEGEITDFTDVRLNDIKQADLKGISVNKYFGTASQVVDGIVGGSNQAERAAKVGSLRNVAYLAINVPKGDKIDANYNLTSIVKGRKIRVYTTPTKYTVKYSENPAWVMFDFLTSYNGLGLCLNNNGTINESLVVQLFDMYSFIESAAYCDEEVTTNGKKSPRFTFNMIFDSQASARDLIDEIYRSCRGGLFTKNGKLQFKIDKAQAVSKVFTAEDIVKGSETFGTIPTEEHYDILKVVYISPDHEWQKVEAFAEIPEYRDGVPIEHAINCYSVTNFQQASRLAWYYVNSKILCPYFGSFKTDYRAYDLEVGDVIQIDSLLMGLEDYLVKVTSVVDDGAGTFTVNWRTYDERLYNDTLGSKEPRVLVSTLSDMYAYPEDVKNFNVVQQDNFFNFTWSYNQDPSNLYEIRMGDTWESGRVIGSNLKANTFDYKILTTGTYRFWIKAYTNYQYSKNPTLDVININAIPNIDEIINFNLIATAQGEYVNTYKYHDTIKLAPLSSENKVYNILGDMAGDFDGMKFYNGFLKFAPEESILWHKDGETWGSEDGYYKTDGAWGAKPYENGVYTSQIYDIEALTSNVVSFDSNYTAVEKNASVEFEWRRSEDGQAWTKWEDITPGGYKYRFFQVRITVNSTSQVLIDKCELDIEFKILWNSTPDKWREGDNQYYQNGGIWGALTKAIGTYTSQVYDIGLLYECLVSFDSQYTSLDEQADVNIYWQYSKDGVNWSSWSIVNNGNYSFRYFRVKAEFDAYNSLQTILTRLKVQVDVKEKFYTQQIEVVDPSAGYTINYDFVKKPAIVATVADNIAKYAVIDDDATDNKHAVIYVYSNAGELTTAKVNLVIQGY